jgi:hypothetical protein
MSELLILGIIVAVVLAFFNREWIKTDSFRMKNAITPLMISLILINGKGERNRQSFE